MDTPWPSRSFARSAPRPCNAYSLQQGLRTLDGYLYLFGPRLLRYERILKQKMGSIALDRGVASTIIRLVGDEPIGFKTKSMCVSRSATLAGTAIEGFHGAGFHVAVMQVPFGG